MPVVQGHKKRRHRQKDGEEERSTLDEVSQFCVDLLTSCNYHYDDFNAQITFGVNFSSCIAWFLHNFASVPGQYWHSLSIVELSFHVFVFFYLVQYFLKSITEYSSFMFVSLWKLWTTCPRLYQSFKMFKITFFSRVWKNRNLLF